MEARAVNPAQARLLITMTIAAVLVAAVLAPRTFSGTSAASAPSRSLVASSTVSPGAALRGVTAPKSTALPVVPAVQDNGPARVRAVVVGINRYPAPSPPLYAAVADATDMISALQRQPGPRPEITALLDGQATDRNIRAALGHLVAASRPQDTVVLFFAGHVRSLGGGTEGFVSADRHLLTDRSMAAVLAPLASDHVWVVMATCYGGGFTELLAPGRILTAASPAGQVSYESARLGRSFLGEYVVRRGLLNGEAGGATVQQVVGWADAMLRRDGPRFDIVNFDRSLGPISLDGVLRTSVPAPAPLRPTAGTPDAAPSPTMPANSSTPSGAEGADGSSSTSTQVPTQSDPPAPATTQPCGNVGKLLCPSP